MAALEDGPYGRATPIAVAPTPLTLAEEQITITWVKSERVAEVLEGLDVNHLLASLSLRRTTADRELQQPQRQLFLLPLDIQHPTLRTDSLVL